MRAKLSETATAETIQSLLDRAPNRGINLLIFLILQEILVNSYP